MNAIFFLMISASYNCNNIIFYRCDDFPIVYTHLLPEHPVGSEHVYLSYGYAGDKLKVLFEPAKLCMMPDTGRVYHPAPDRIGGVGLVKSKLAIELSQYFIYENDDITQTPSQFEWAGKIYQLSNNLSNAIKCGSAYNGL